MPLWLQALIGSLTLLFLGYAAFRLIRGERPASGAAGTPRPTEPERETVARSSQLAARSYRNVPSTQDDTSRIIAWYRDAVAHLPPTGPFEPVSAVLVPDAPALGGLRLHVDVNRYDDAPEDLAYLELRIAAANGESSISQDQGLGTRDALLAELETDRVRERIAELLDRAGAEVWRGSSELGLDERIAAVHAGTHASPPQGPDCERLDPDRPRAFDEADQLLDGDYLAISLHRCSECGQRFVHQFIEVWGDRWDFWTRVSDEEAALIRDDYGWATAILLARRRLTDPPGGKPAYWDESPEMVLRMGPRW